jgi:hypothetical protein
MSIESIVMGVLPSIGALAIFFFAVRGVIRADRNERAAIAREEAEAAAAQEIRASSSNANQSGDTPPTP